MYIHVVKIGVIPIVLKSLVLISISILLAIFFNFISPNKISWITKYRSISAGGRLLKKPVYGNQVIEYSDISIHPAEEINLIDVYKLYKGGRAIFLDARSFEDYKKGHIQGALSTPSDELGLIDSLIKELDLSQKIVAYCDDEECLISIDLALYLEEYGFYDVYFFVGGWSNWIGSGYPVSSGEKP